MVKDPGRVPSSGVTELLLTRQASSFLLLEPRESRWERLCVCRWAEGRQKSQSREQSPVVEPGVVTWAPSPALAQSLLGRSAGGQGQDLGKGDQGQGRGRPEDRTTPQTAKGPSEQVKGLDGDPGALRVVRACRVTF